MSTDTPGTEDVELPFISHLLELRTRLLHIVIAVMVLVVAYFPFANHLYTWLAEPLIRQMPAGASMIATDVASPFLTPFKLVVVLAIFTAVPYILYQIWAFVAPGLYTHEKKLIVPLLVSSTALFYTGVAFAYFAVFPVIFKFFTSVAPKGVEVMTDITKYLDFVLTLFFAFGAAFEIPIAIVLLVWAEIVEPDALVAKRPYVVVGCFVVGAFLTPPDVFSQSLLAIPMWLLFEAGVFFSRIALRHKRQREAEVEAESAEESDADESMDETLDRYEQDEADLRGDDDDERK